MPSLPSDYVTSLCQQQDERPETTRGTDRLIHVSSIPTLCPRKYVIMQRHQVEGTSALTSGHQICYAIGRKIDEHVKDAVIASHGRQAVYGLWTCSCGTNQHTGMHPGTHPPCPLCSTYMNVYNEPTIVSEDYLIGGRPDVTLLVGGHHLLVIEIKSMTKNQLDSLAEPTSDHLFQAMMYRWLYQQQGMQVHDNVCVLYVRKEFIWGNPYREFHVDATLPANQRLLELGLEQCAIVRDHLAAGTIPPRRLCSAITCTKAKECHVSGLCFSME